MVALAVDAGSREQWILAFESRSDAGALGWGLTPTVSAERCPWGLMWHVAAVEPPCLESKGPASREHAWTASVTLKTLMGAHLGLPAGQVRGHQVKSRNWWGL